MSLFQARDCWGLHCGDDEHFDHHSLCVANIDNSPEGIDKLIIGSHSGILRVFMVNSGLSEGGIRPFQPNDLLLEADLQSPILQVSAGMLLSATDKLNLAVLHPRKLCVFSISATAGVADHGSAYNMLLIYEHNLQRSAFSLVIGSFGHVKGRHFLCVQCLDGTLSFYEQESFAFSRFLPNFLLPGPLAYVHQNDSFVVSTSNWSLESYRYQVLAIAKQEDDGNHQLKHSGRKATPDWSITIGESVIDINVISLESFQAIIVLGERNLFAVKESGVLWFMKKFDFCPVSMCTHLNDNSDLIIMVASEMHTLLIYNKDVLKWASKLPFTPVAFRRANVRNMQGSLVCLSENGFLNCFYLGTNPSLHILASNNTEVNITNYAEAEQELQQLKQIINAFHMDSTVFPSSASGTKSLQTSEVSIIISEPHPVIDSSGKLARRTNDEKPLLTISVHLQTHVSVTNVRLTADVSYPLSIEPKVLTFPVISANENPGESQFLVSAKDTFVPQNLQLNVIATYFTSDGTPRAAHKSVDLPLYLVAKMCAPVKEAEHTLSFDVICQSQISLRELFSDISDNADSTNIGTDITSVYIGFYDKECPAVTINLVSRIPHQKFRLKSDSVASLAFIGSELMKMLEKYKAKYDKASFNKNLLPLEAYFQLIDNHLLTRHKMLEDQETLSVIASQFRALQKRLLVKLKDRNPSPLTNLDLILEMTHNKVMKLSDKLLKNATLYCKSSNDLSLATDFLCSWISIAVDMKQEQITLLKAALTSFVGIDVDEGWEERVETALFTLLNNVKDNIGISKFANMDLSVPDNTSTLRNLIDLAITRIYSGEMLASTTVVNKEPPVAYHKPQALTANEVIPEEDETEHTTTAHMNNAITTSLISKVSTV